MTRLWPLALLIACGGELTVDPGSLEWGVVDFTQPLPDAGHDAIDVTLTNAGSGSLAVVITYPDDRLTLLGQLTSQDPPTIELGPDEVRSVSIGVSDYEAGELDTEVSGTIAFAALRLNADTVVPWSYTPQREAPGD